MNRTCDAQLPCHAGQCVHYHHLHGFGHLPMGRYHSQRVAGTALAVCELKPDPA